MRKLHERPSVRVQPANADMRRLLKHPKAGGFRGEGSMEWPDDMFTRKRLRDGDITIVERNGEQQQRSSGRGHQRARSE
jgi:hypothetical protein